MGARLPLVSVGGVQELHTFTGKAQIGRRGREKGRGREERRER